MCRSEIGIDSMSSKRNDHSRFKKKSKSVLVSHTKNRSNNEIIKYDYQLKIKSDRQ